MHFSDEDFVNVKTKTHLKKTAVPHKYTEAKSTTDIDPSKDMSPKKPCE